MKLSVPFVPSTEVFPAQRDGSSVSAVVHPLGITSVMEPVFPVTTSGGLVGSKCVY